jgi:SOS-response transcriptional repressor LexA
MKKFAARVVALRKSLGMTQAEFGAHIASSRGYISQIEAGLKAPGPDFVKKIETLERSQHASKIAEYGATGIAGRNATKVAETGPTGEAGVHEFNVDLRKIELRKIPVYSFVQAGQAVDYEALPESWEDTIEYDGNDKSAFALRVSGDSMMPNFPPGTIITISPQYPPHNGNLVVAKIRGEGVLFKLFHHNGAGTQITLTSYNAHYPAIVIEREKLHWLWRVVRATQNL